MFRVRRRYQERLGHVLCRIIDRPAAELFDGGDLEGARKDLMACPFFRPEFEYAKERVAQMEFRAVQETDQVRQALLEIYCAVQLQTPYNKFRTH